MYKRKIGFSFLLIGIYLIGIFALCKNRSSFPISMSTYSLEKGSTGNRKEVIKEKAIGTLSIPKIQLKRPFFSLESKENNVEQNVTVLNGSTYPNQEESKFFLAAHSGNSEISFFQNLGELEIGDTFDIQFQDQTYTYQIARIESQEKTGKIQVPVNHQKQAILTTCHPTQKEKQLILIANIQKETGSNN